jgi:hypothetical protein
MKYFLALFLAASFSGAYADGPAKTRQECNDPDSQCWCSQSCGYRDKTEEDNPIYIKNDRNGKFCYCKQWDLDYYDKNCKQGKNVKQPAGSK